MSLSGNTEKINELLSKINALPEAGESSGGGTQIITGDFTLTSSFNDVSVPVVTGLGFTPSIVVVWFTGNSSYYQGKAMYHMVTYGFNPRTIYTYGKNEILYNSPTGSTGKIVVDSDGFHFESSSTTGFADGIYAWIAIG